MTYGTINSIIILVDLIDNSTHDAQEYALNSTHSELLQRGDMTVH